MAAEKGISVALYDMIFLKPIDTAILREITDRGLDIITIEDGTINGGLGSAVAEWLEDNNISGCRLTRLGLPDKFVPQGTPAQLAQLCGIDAESIFNTIVSLASEKNNSEK